MAETTLELNADRDTDIFDPESLIRQVECLEQDVQSLTRQVARDFEELALLQSLAVPLQQSATPEPLALMMDFLPKLPLSTMCDAVAIVPNAEMFADHDHASGPCFALWSGEPLVEDFVCQALIHQYGDQAQADPVVMNDLAIETVDPRVNSFILVEIRHADRLAGWLIAFNHVTSKDNYNQSIQTGFTTIEAGLILTAASILATQLHNTRMVRQKEQLFTDVVRAMVNAVEARDDYTCGHSERVALFAQELAREAGLPNTHCERIYLTGLLHDVGKIAVPDAVLQKTGMLDDQERSIIETHPDVGWRILYPLSNQLSEVLPGVLFHHERIDGKGYPDGLVGNEIPLDGRILAISDAYDAMTSDRPYRKGMDQEKAEVILRGGAGTQWDAELMEHFFAAMPRIIQIRESYCRREARTRQRGSSMPV